MKSGFRCQPAEHAALLIDIGKLGIPRHIREKWGKLSAEELKLMKKSPDIADYMNLEGSQIEALAPKFDYTVDISQEDIDSLNDTIAFLYKVKQIPSIFDISDHIWKQ